MPDMPLSAATVKITSAYKCYKDKPAVARFYCQTKGGNVTAVISYLEGYINLWTAGSDVIELNGFISFLNPLGVFCEDEIITALPLKEKVNVLVRENIGSDKTVGYGFDVRAMVKVLSNSLPVESADYLVADLACRLYSGNAYAVSENYGAAVVLKGEKSALLSLLAVNEDSRGRGYGTLLIEKVSSGINAEKLFVCCSNDNLDFYKSNGFVPFSMGYNYERV